MAPDTAMALERPVGVGLRDRSTGYAFQDTSCWEAIWNIYARTLGPKPAKLAIGGCQQDVRAFAETSAPLFA